jgi:hypothetical protein
MEFSKTLTRKQEKQLANKQKQTGDRKQNGRLKSWHANNYNKCK